MQKLVMQFFSKTCLVIAGSGYHGTNIFRLIAFWEALGLSLLVLAACNQLTPEPTRLAGLAIGKLELDKGCLHFGGTNLIWPPDYEVKIGQTSVTVRTDKGVVTTLQLGSTVHLSGGATAPEFLDARTRANIPPGCPPPYFLVGSEVREASPTEIPPGE